MNKFVINVRNFSNMGEELDKLLVPNEIYELTMNRETEKIQQYFIDNPKLMLNFVGFNSVLKKSAILSSDRKCGCFYNLNWKTKYAEDNNLEKTILLFNQQIKLYRYMIENWYPKNNLSNLRYLSNIALDIIQEIRKFNYNINNNLIDNSLLNKSYINNKFDNKRELFKYLYNLKKI